MKVLLSLALLAGAPTPDDERIEGLVVDLGGPTPEEAVEALAAEGPGVLPSLLAAYEDNLRASWQATRIIARFGPKAHRATDDLAAIAADQDRYDELRAHAICALAHIGPKAEDAVEPLLGILAERPLRRRHLAAVLALQRIGEVRALQEPLQGPDRLLGLLVASAVANMDPPPKAARKPLQRVLADEDAYLLYPQAARGLQALGTGDKDLDRARERERKLLRGAAFDRSVFTDGQVARHWLQNAGLVTADGPLSLPERLWDFDGNGACHEAEFLQGLGRHLGEELGRLAGELSQDRFADVQAFEANTDDVLALAGIVEKLVESSTW